MSRNSRGSLDGGSWLLAHALGERVYVLAEINDPMRGVELIREAIAIADGHAPVRVLA